MNPPISPPVPPPPPQCYGAPPPSPFSFSPPQSPWPAQFNPMQVLREVPMPMPCTRKLRQLLALSPKDESEIFSNRLLCRHGVAICVGGTGTGKSSWIIQGAINWCLWLEFCGFKPLLSLRVLIIQAENDAHDCAEQVRGAVNALGLTEEQITQLDDRFLAVTLNSVTGDMFCEMLRRLITQHSADLVIIDPALAYLGGDANSQAEVGRFLRQGLAPILQETNSAAILIHHTAKPSWDRNKDGGRSDAYVGAGSAEWANFSRLVFGINSTDVPGYFELFLGKRGRRAGWRDAQGKIVTKRIIRHSEVEGELCWVEVDQRDFQAAREKSTASSAGPTLDEFVAIFPKKSDGAPQQALLSAVQIRKIFKSRRWDESSCRLLRDEAVKIGRLGVFVGPANAKFTGLPSFVDQMKAAQVSKRQKD